MDEARDASLYAAQIHPCTICGLLPCECPDEDDAAPGEPTGTWVEVGFTTE